VFVGGDVKSVKTNVKVLTILTTQSTCTAQNATVAIPGPGCQKSVGNPSKKGGSSDVIEKLWRKKWEISNEMGNRKFNFIVACGILNDRHLGCHDCVKRIRNHGTSKDKVYDVDVNIIVSGSTPTVT